MNGFLGLSFVIWAGICLVIAIIYLFIWPRPQSGQVRPAWLNFILHWFHSLVWLLLATACLAWDRGIPSLGGPLALAAMMVYIVFLIAMVFDRRRRS